MSALGQKQTLDWRLPMSALPPKADIAARQLNVRFVPKADHAPQQAPALFDHFVGDGHDTWRYGQTQCLGSFQIDNQLKFCRTNNG
jgi:hypothetical protein